MALILGSASSANALQKEGIAAVVNDNIVSFSDVRARMRLAITAMNIKLTKENQLRLRREVLSNLIDEALQLEAAKKLNIVITQAQIDSGLNSIAQKNGYSVESFTQEMKSKDVPIYTLEDQLKAQMAWTQVVRRTLRPKINISENEIDAVLDEKERHAGKSEFEVAEIFLSVSSEEEAAYAKDFANKLLEKLVKGASFVDVARRHSQSPGAVNGGDLGWIQIGQLSPELDSAIQKMKPGQVSPPLRSAQGVHILFLKNVRKNAKIQRAPMVDTPKTTIVHLKQIFIPIEKTDPEQVIGAKVARAKQLKSEIPSCAVMEKTSQKFTSPATGDLGKVALESLPESVVTTVNALPIGTLSDPLRNSRGIFVLMVCDRADPVQMVNAVPVSTANVMPLRDDEAYRERIANQIGLERLESLQKRYLQDLRAMAFIDRRI